MNLDLDLPRPANDKTTLNGAELEVRILPMSKEEEFPGWSVEDMQNDFFLADLLDNNGFYYYRNYGMNCAKGSLVLFQFDNAIIAAARILEIEKYETPVDGLYYGAYVFDVKSVITFEPINFDELHNIDINLKHFSQVKQIINHEHLEKILELIRHKQNTVFAEELPSKNVHLYTEGVKKQIVVNAYERNYRARQECIKHKGDTCLICGFNFGDFYGEEFKGKIHVHHIKSLAEINGEYEIDPINDLIPVCPNCHLALHSKAGGEIFGIDELKTIIQKQKKI